MMKVRLAFLHNRGGVSIGPRDGASQEWLKAHTIHIDGAMAKLRRHVNEAANRVTLHMWCAEFQENCQREWDEFVRSGYGSALGSWTAPEEIRFEVRLCEYRPKTMVDGIVTEEMLVEL